MKALDARSVKQSTLPVLLALTFFTLAVPDKHALSQGPIPPGYRIVEYDAPGAGTVPYSGTEAVSINSRGATTGYMYDNNFGGHSFVRNPDGKVIVFDAPNAAFGTYALSINDRGVIAGLALDGNAVWHGFLRNPDGTFVIFDAPGVSPGVGNFVGTQPQAINNRGEVAGYYAGGDFVVHGFVRAPDGKITLFDDPEGGAGAYQGSWTYSINDEGTIAGAVNDPSNGSHGFIRSHKGGFTNFDFPGETSTAYNSALINNDGVTAGYYVTPTGFVSGYVRSPEGKLTPFVPPVAGGASAVWNFGLGPNGEALGRVNDTNSLGHAYIRYPNGKTAIFDVPNQIMVSNPNSWGSELWAENEEGVIVGEFIDASYVVHSFLLIPR